MIAERRFVLSIVSPRKRILVIEDDKKMARSLREGFDERGYDVQVASSGEEGFFVVFSFRPDLLVLDLNLPGRGGLEILRQLREQALDLRILVLTSHNELEERVQGLREGADDYLGKPFAFSELMSAHYAFALFSRGRPDPRFDTTPCATVGNQSGSHGPGVRPPPLSGRESQSSGVPRDAGP
jgi:DNA-binding response OmpR family regulator